MMKMIASGVAERPATGLLAWSAWVKTRLSR
jgi:hypothetical protein